MFDLNDIYKMNCIDGMAKMPSESVDLIVTDPPYLISYKTGRRKEKDHKFCSEIMNDNNEDLIIDYLNECYRILKNDSAAYVFCSSKTIDIFKQQAEMAGFVVKNIIIWVKNNWTAGDLTAQFGQQYEPCLLLNKGRKEFNGARISDVWKVEKVVGDDQLHQNQKPIGLIERCVLKHSSENDIVFDGFMGSGTTAVAAINLKRRFIGFEIDDFYFNVAQDRINKVKENGSQVSFDFLNEIG